MSGFNPFGTGQGLSTDATVWIKRQSGFNPFGTGQGLSTEELMEYGMIEGTFQSLWNRAGSFDIVHFAQWIKKKLFQSLWNRAGSFDTCVVNNTIFSAYVSIPLEQGRVFRPFRYLLLRTISTVSIPLEQGRVFRL